MSGTSLMVMAWCCSMRKCMMWWLIANQWSSGEEAPPGQMQTGHRLWLSSALLYKFTQDPQRLSNSLYFVFFFCIMYFILIPAQLNCSPNPNTVDLDHGRKCLLISNEGPINFIHAFRYRSWPKLHSLFTQVIQLFYRWFPTQYFSLPPNIAGCEQLLNNHDKESNMFMDQPIKSVYRCE